MQLDTVTLPDDLFWSDEFDWSGVGQTIKRSVTGASVIQEQLMQFGRPIVLAGSETAGWVTRAVILDLFALAAQADKEMTLTLGDGRVHQVRFDRSGGAPIEAREVLPVANPGVDSLYYVTLRLITVG